MDRLDAIWFLGKLYGYPTLNRKKAVILVPSILIGGTEISSLDTAISLKKLGYKVTAIIYFDEIDEAMVQEFKAENICLKLLRLERKKSWLTQLMLMIRLFILLQPRLYSLVWVQYMTPTLIPLIVSRASCNTVVAAVHVSAGHYTSQGLKRLKWIARWLCTYFVCVSHTVAKGIFGVPSNDAIFRKVRVLPNSISLSGIHKLPATNWKEYLGVDCESVFVGYIGRLAFNKGPDVFVNSAAILADRYPAIKWLIIGDGVELVRLKESVESRGLRGRVYFIGRLPHQEVYAAIKGLDIVVVPSREEGFGLSALEAMACGTPLVASKVDALVEIVRDRETGLLFERENVIDLAHKIEEIMRNPTLHSELSNNSVRYVEENYSRSLYQKLLYEMIEKPTSTSR